MSLFEDSLLLGIGRFILPLPAFIWKRRFDHALAQDSDHLAFLPPGHRVVRNYVVRELPRVGKPIPPEQISRDVEMPLPRVQEILEQLERHMTFLFRNPDGAVAWAYPVTVEPTPHQVTFSSGEKLYAAWAVDAIATPFVQGRLRREPLTVLVETQCAHCGAPIQIEIDQDLRFRVLQPDARPLVFSPQVNFQKLKDPSIIDAFWRCSTFFWSEEHARAYRLKHGGVRGSYQTLAQMAWITVIEQGALFGFPRE